MCHSDATPTTKSTKFVLSPPVKACVAADAVGMSQIGGVTLTVLYSVTHLAHPARVLSMERLQASQECGAILEKRNSHSCMVVPKL